MEQNVDDGAMRDVNGPRAISASASARDKARDRKRRFRAGQREASRLAAVAEALRMEAAAEAVSPRQVRIAVVDGDRWLRGPTVSVVDGIPRRVTGLDSEPTDALRLPRKLRDAADRLRADWVDVGSGVSAGVVDPTRVGGRGSGDGPHLALLRQVAARTRLDAALLYVGAFGPCVSRVVFDGIPVTRWALETGRTNEAARGWVVAALERVAAFYEAAASVSN